MAYWNYHILYLSHKSWHLRAIKHSFLFISVYVLYNFLLSQTLTTYFNITYPNITTIYLNPTCHRISEPASFHDNVVVSRLKDHDDNRLTDSRTLTTLTWGTFTWPLILTRKLLKVGPTMNQEVSTNRTWDSQWRLVFEKKHITQFTDTKSFWTW